MDPLTVPPAPRTPTPRAAKLIFGWHGVQKQQRLWLWIGCVLSAFCALMFSIDLPNDWLIDSDLARSPGQVIEQRLNKGTKVLGERTTTIRYAFQAKSGRVEGQIDTTSDAMIAKAVPGAAVTVEYAAGDPALSRIQGASASTFGWVGALAWLPFVGSLMAFGSLKKARRDAQMAYRHGTVAQGRIVFADVDRRQNGRNRAPIYLIKWQFHAGGKTLTGSLQTDSQDDYRDVMAAQEWPVLYDPKKPERNTLYV